MKPVINIKRIYEETGKADGYRILVDRLWPRGIKKENAPFDKWIKEAGPSNELRKWFNHEVEKWDEFVQKYRKELKVNSAFDELFEEIKKHEKVCLLYSAKDEEHNQAIVLKQYLLKRLNN